MIRPVRWVGLAILGLSCLAGCGGASSTSLPTSSEQIAVTGQITLGGMPASGGKIEFLPNNASGPVSAEVQADGKFTITTGNGPNTVTYTPAAPNSQPLPPRTVIVESDNNQIDVDF
jgi:hypothetical protein